LRVAAPFLKVLFANHAISPPPHNAAELTSACLHAFCWFLTNAKRLWSPPTKHPPKNPKTKPTPPPPQKEANPKKTTNHPPKTSNFPQPPPRPTPPTPTPTSVLSPPCRYATVLYVVLREEPPSLSTFRTNFGELSFFVLVDRAFFFPCIFFLLNSF